MATSTLGNQKASDIYRSSELFRCSTPNGLASSSIVGSRTQVHIASSSVYVNGPCSNELGPGGKRKRRRYEPDGSYSWVVLAASFVANLIADGCMFSFGVLYVELLDYFKQSKATTAWVGSLFMAVPLVTGPVASIITNRFGCRKTTILGSLFAATGFVLSSFANSIGQLCFTLGIVAAVGLSMVDVAANVIVAYYFERRRGFATSTAAAGSGIGTFVFAILTEKLVELYTWKGAVLVIGGIMLNMIVCGAFFLPVDIIEKESDEEEHDCIEKSMSTLKEKSQFKTVLHTLHPIRLKNFIRENILNGAICHSLGFIYFAISCFLLYMWYDIPYIYIPDVARGMGISEQMASFLVSIIGIVSTVGQIVIGYLGDRPQVDTFYLYSALTAVAGIVTMFVPLMKDFAGMAAYAGAYGLFISANYALTTILLVDLVSMEHLTSGYGLLLLVQGIANLIGPPVAGWISDYTKTYDLTFYTSGAGIMLSGLMLFARPWLLRCAPHRYYGSEVNKMRAEAENASLKETEANRTNGTKTPLTNGTKTPLPDHPDTNHHLTV